MIDLPFNLDGLSDELRDGIERVICERVSDAVKGAKERNSQLQIWRDQLENLSVTSSNKTWDNACNLCDPISMESFLTILSQITSSLHRDPKVSVEALSPDREEDARLIEAWLTMESNRSDANKHLSNLAYDACWSQAAICYLGWSQKTRKVRDVGYSKSNSSKDYLPSDQADDPDYSDEVPVTEVVVEEGFDIRSVDLSNFFMYPPTSKSIDRATLICERMVVTEEELYDGIEDYGYDEDMVEELVRLGPSKPTDEDSVVASQDGLEIEVSNSGFYEIFTVYTRLPRRVPGMLDTVPKHLLQDDFLAVCSADNQIVLKLAFSPFRQRPYFDGGILPKRDSILGHALMGMVEGLQAEANANIQFTIDNMNLTNCPVMVGPKSEAENVNKAKVQPGSYIGTDLDPKSIIPLIWDRSIGDPLAIQQDLRNRAKSLVSAEGQGELQSKVRKQAEIDNVQAQSSAKFGMYLSNFNRTIVSELYRRMILLKEQFTDEDGEEFLDQQGHSGRLTSQALNGKYVVTATGTSLTYSPEARVAINEHKMQVTTNYLLAGTKLPPGQMKLLWHGTREILFDLGERNPDAWIGKEPEEEPPPEAPDQPQNIPVGGNGTGQVPNPLYGGMMNGLGANN